MKQCVEIQLDTDTGKVMVGLKPPESYPEGGGESPAVANETGQVVPPAAPAAGPATPAPAAEPEDDRSYLQPANSLDEALATAKQLLTNPQAAAANAAPQGAPAAEPNAQEAAMARYQQIRGGA